MQTSIPKRLFVFKFKQIRYVIFKLNLKLNTYRVLRCRYAIEDGESEIK